MLDSLAKNTFGMRPKWMMFSNTVFDDFPYNPFLNGQKEDLGRVLKMYRMWAHVLYPKAKFRDAIDTIEKLCHKRPLQVYRYLPISLVYVLLQSGMIP